ncbi:MAG TPA: transcriptional regulator, partial [Povalibacter sp.]|nr:transcriptional regulator [Povalibacter sp.]
DRLVHEPARLAILTALSACRDCDFTFMQAITHITKGNLSNHLLKLEEGQLVEIQKGYKGRTPRTRIRITAKGRAAIDTYWRRLEQLRTAARDWHPQARTQED